MTSQTFSEDPTTSRTEHALALDERSMRLLELAVAGIALLAAVLLTVAR